MPTISELTRRIKQNFDRWEDGLASLGESLQDARTASRPSLESTVRFVTQQLQHYSGDVSRSGRDFDSLLEQQQLEHRQRVTKLGNDLDDQLQRCQTLNQQLIDSLETTNQLKTTQTRLREELAVRNNRLAHQQSTIRRLETELSDRPPRPPPTPPDNRSTDEVLGEDALAKGYRAFELRDFQGARSAFENARARLQGVPLERRTRHETPELDYQVAISDAYDVSIERAEQVLFDYVQRNTRSGDATQELRKAHAKHLLAQVYVGLARFADARKVGDEAEATRRQFRADDIHRETQALLLRIAQLENDQRRLQDPAVFISFGSPTWQEYSGLEPIPGRGPDSTGLAVFRPSPYASQLLPIRFMGRLAPPPPPPPPAPPSSEPGSNGGSRSPSRPRTGISPAIINARKAWLHELGLRAGPNTAELREAIVHGDAGQVRRLLAWHPAGGALTPALHVAALCGDVDTARQLVHAGANVNAACDAQSGAGGDCHGVTPMHLAVIARHTEMIAFLRSRRASFGRVDLGPQKRTVAPAFWLVSERWVQWFRTEDPEAVVDVLRHMSAQGWEPSSALNLEGRNLRHLAPTLLRYWPELRDSVMDFLDQRRDSFIGD